MALQSPSDSMSMGNSVISPNSGIDIGAARKAFCSSTVTSRSETIRDKASLIGLAPIRRRR
jgi:hypothetical protein